MLRWAFDLAPPGYDYSTRPVSEDGYALGTPNVWSAMSVDHKRDLVFLPTGNPSPDYDRPLNGDLSHFGSSVVALRASTGEVVWHFQTVLSDLWDFDVPAQPVLTDFEIDGVKVPAVVQATKMGFVFVLHRETGEPLVEVVEQPVDVHGPLAAQLSPVQPFPPQAFQVSRQYESGASLLGLCDDMDAQSVVGPVYTPITEQWTIGLPSNMGAINWGGVAVTARSEIVVHTNSVPFRTKLIERQGASDLLSVLETPGLEEAEYDAAWQSFRTRYDLPENVEVARQHTSNYLMARHVYLDPLVGIPCAGLPMGEILVIDGPRQAVRWRVPHGSLRDFVGLPLEYGVPDVGGPLATEGGLIFIG